MKVFEALRWASSVFKSCGRDENAGEILLQHVLKMEKYQLLAHLRMELPEERQKEFRELVRKHAAGVPVQYLTGCEYFYGRKFFVNGHVLIPRPETEELVAGTLERIRKYFSGTSPLRAADAGTGSGAIAVTLALEMPALEVSASDISEEALKVAAKNAELHGAGIDFRQGDFLAPFFGEKAFDVIVSNPPYIPLAEKEKLPDVVKDHEPGIALFAGEDGLDAYRKIIGQLPMVINSRALAAFEIGDGQGDKVKDLIERAFPGAIVEIERDINRKERMVFAFLHGESS